MDYEKLTPSLIAAVEDYAREGRPGLELRPRLIGLVTNSPLRKPVRAVAFLRCDRDTPPGHLAELGVQVNQPWGDLRTGIVGLDSLDALTDSPLVRQVVPARRLRTLMDIAPGKVGLTGFRAASGLTGAGVVVGVIDTGIDPRHPAFSGRVLALWDQTLRGGGVPEGRYGAELTGADQQLSRDLEGHGTHVAGIAAGAGAGGNPYGGVAPGAELVIVKSDLLDAHIADGIRYVFRLAAERGRPAVVNLSLGGHADAHDGTDPLSQILDAESGPGRLVCCAAGNEGDENIHAALALQGRLGQTGTVAFRVPPPSGGDAVGLVVLNAWYDGGDEVEVAVTAPSGLATPFQAVLRDGSPTRAYDLPDGRVRITTQGPDPGNGDHNVAVEVEPAALVVPPANSRTWQLQVRATRALRGQVDVWILDDSLTLDAQFSGASVADRLKIGSPGAATRAITVASYTTRTAWTDAAGVARSVPAERDTISTFSSEGPRRDGLAKPDVTAPGSWIASALSRDATFPPDLVLDAEHVVLQGTSMAAPFVSGLLALLLERDPDLDPERARALLRGASRLPAGSASGAGGFDPKWGFGLLDAAAL